MTDYTAHLPACMKWLRLNCSRPTNRWPSHLGPDQFGPTWGFLTVTVRGDVVLKMRDDLLPEADRAWLRRQGFKTTGSVAGVVIYHHSSSAKVPAWLAAMQAEMGAAANVDWASSSRHGGHYE